MAKVWLVIEEDWESSIVLEAWTTEAKAAERAKAIEADARAKARQSSVYGVYVEEIELQGD